MIKIEKCTPEEFKDIREKHKLQIQWLDDCGNDKVLYEGKVIAILFTCKGETDNSLELISFEVLERGNGYGKMIVNILKANYGCIRLYQDNNSDGFWIKMGFRYSDDGLGTRGMVYSNIYACHN